MSERDDPQTTLVNPFKDGKDRRVRHWLRPRSNTGEKPAAPPKPAPVPEDQPPFYVSQASKRHIAGVIEKGELNSDELPTIYKLAAIICKIFKRPSPTYSDIETATKFRSIEHVKQVASGEDQEFDIIRNEMRGMDVMPKKERLKLWKTVAEMIIEQWTEN